MFGASSYALYKHWHSLGSSDFLVLGIGFVVAFISAYFVVRRFLAFVANHGYGVFAWYRIFIGSLMLSYLITKEYLLV
jgi:undecaprenyl-diphosphatase